MKNHTIKHPTDESFRIDSQQKDRSHLSQLLLNASLNSQKDIIILALDRDYKYYFFNEKHRLAMKAYYGVDVEVGMSILDAVTTDIDKENSRINYGKAMAGESHTTIQTFGDLNVSTFETVYSPLVNDQGEIVGATAYARDVTERIKAEQQLRASEEENRLLIEAMSQGIANHDVIYDDHGKPVDYVYRYVNENYERMTGLKRDDILGRRVSEVLPQTETYWWDAFEEVSVTRQPKRVVNHSAELGKFYSISFYSPKPHQVSGIVDDITSLIEIQQQLIDSELRYHLLAQRSQTVIWETDPDLTFRYVSPVVEHLLGYTPEELVGTKTLSDLYPAATAVRDAQTLSQTLANPTSSTPMERLLAHKTNDPVWVETYVVAVTDSSGAVVKYRGSDKDITERKHKEEAILFANTHDHLTQLYNRRYFDQALIVIDTPQNRPLSILMADLNGLKLINDAFGHSAGDTLLMEISSRLNQLFAHKGTVARIGGDEFCVLLPNTSLHEARQLANEAKRHLEEGKILGVQRSISLGVATKTGDGPLGATLIAAEDDMYARKLYETASHRSETIKTILQTLHEKNPREEAHSKRVSMICTAMGEVLGMNDDEKHLLTTISNLHDIGKIAIDERILNKQGKLDAQEWDIIKKHPEIGYRILSASSEYAEVAIDILSHHERYDGKGYPRGLHGEEIPLRARIIAIVDAFDAMISQRTYRATLTLDQAIQELINGKGTQFDPKLVDLFLSLPIIHN